MDKWKYYDITHKNHLVCNPMNRAKFDKLCSLLRLKEGERVLDIACGKGELLIRLAELYGISGVGVDISPYCVRDCREKHRERAPESDIKFIEMDGADYEPEPSKLFDLTACVGASWVYDGHRGTIRALTKMTKAGGLVLVGEPFWLREPSEEYLTSDSMKREDFSTHQENIGIGEEEGLTCLYTMASSHDDWDHYETLQWWSVDDYVKENPDDEDNPDLLERSRKAREIYLRWGRETLGWAIYIFRKQ